MAPGNDGDPVKRRRFVHTLPSSSNPDDVPHAPPLLPTLPFELIEEILQWLPVKFLLQLQCVCKSWKTLISDPQFAKNHLRSSPKATRVISCLTTPSIIVRTYPLPSVFDAVTLSPTELRYPLANRGSFDWIVDSCDGIICLNVFECPALLWNPSTGKSKRLPPLDNPSDDGFTIYGFGHDRLADSYKVVSVFCYESDDTYKTEANVLNLGTDSWRRIQDFPYSDSVIPIHEMGKFVSSSVNWVAFNVVLDDYVVVALDLQKESYEEVLLPDYGPFVDSLSVFVLRECLGVICNIDYMTIFDVWLMEDYGNVESWTKLFRVPNMEGHPLHTLCISEDDRVLLEIQSKLIVCNSRNGTVKIREIQDSIECMTSDSAVYVESLISPFSLV